MEKMKAAAAVLLLLVLLSSQVEETKSQQYSCIDMCTTGCVASYINNDRLRQRCERKCDIRCSPVFTALIT
ncbi:hypothetical protein Taro_054108 [Colocasia esculenta]|uniref:Uncharacterized protein n=1 Tax=Colocasia esculenta TaxID=4460 RepID=A0A843XQ35_COLES|nr:hypothetical protein [Colocasia esculenta]